MEKEEIEKAKARLVEAYETLRQSCTVVDCPDCPLYGRWGCLTSQDGLEPYRWHKFSKKEDVRI